MPNVAVVAAVDQRSDLATPAKASRADGVRRDIQGLRALAVAIVVIYHFWPRWLPGGYVGVDVFFVISGFLITDHLLRRPPTSPKQLAAFWARRVRRLLPAATLVLGVTLIACLVWLPQTLLPQAFLHTGAAAIYVANWAIARDAGDYLAADYDPTPVQHYWSLSVEEQFYLLWPLLIAALVLLGRRFGRQTAWLWAGVATVVTASLAASVVVTQHEPSLAYYATYVRMWELGAGALVALWVTRVTRQIPPDHPVRQVLAGSGWLLLLGVSLFFSQDTQFPGWMAVLPVSGAMLVIAAAAPASRWSTTRVVDVRPVQWLGDVSYSVYLWHWPVLVIASYALGQEGLRWPVKLALLAVVLVAAGLTKVFVEDRLRYQRGIVRTLPRSFALGAVCSLSMVALSVGLSTHADAQRRVDEQAVQQILTGYVPCAGADALVNPTCAGQQQRLLTSPSFAKQDKSILYAKGCENKQPFTSRKVCTFGPEHPSATIALVGNSHANHWFPALKKAADTHGWRINTYIASACYSLTTEQISFKEELWRGNCQQFNRWVMDSVLSARPTLVVISNRTFHQLVGVPAGQRDAKAAAGYAQTLRQITQAGIPVLMMRDTPEFARSIPDCLAENDLNVSACTLPLSKLAADPMVEAAGQVHSPLITVGDLTSLVCPQGVCQPIIGGVIVYFDKNHLSATFAATLTLQIEQVVQQALRSAPARSG